MTPHEVARAREELRRGDAIASNAAVADLVARFRDHRRASSSADEPFPLVDPEGRPRGAGADELRAPRWLCHLLGLRHASANVVLVAPNGLVLLQKRSRWKDTAPGRLDTSVAGHVGAGRSTLAAAQDEMREELGLDPSHLATPLEPLGEPFFHLDPGARSVDAEVVGAFLGRLAAGALDSVRFADGEVTRLILAPPDEVWALVARGPLTAVARAVLPRALDRLEGA
jgi:8-oxo-dGTP pyrophosphatase MutT (NUDIX family)